MENCKGVRTPIEINDKPIEMLVNKPAEQSLYQSIVGSLLFLSTRTRPDISFSVSKASRSCTEPNEGDMCKVKRILRYLKITSGFGITYKKGKGKIIGFADADWAGDVRDRKSTSGYCFVRNGGAVSWQTSKQNCIALSTCEAEFVSLSGACQEAIWLKRLVSEMENKPEESILIKEDNQAAIAISKDSSNHKKAKHIDIKFQFSRMAVETKQVELEYCPSNKNIADLLTKGVSTEKFHFFRSEMGVGPPESGPSFLEEC